MDQTMAPDDIQYTFQGMLGEIKMFLQYNKHVL